MSQKSSNKYSPREDARQFLPTVVQKLKDEIENGKGGIALIKAAELLVKLSDLDTIPQEIDDEIKIEDADPSKRKVVSIAEAV